MKKFLPLLLLLGMGSSAYAGGIVSSHTSSVQLTVDAARTDASRIGSSFSISGSNIDTTDGTTAGTVSAGTITSGVYAPGAIAATQDTAGAPAAVLHSGDAVPTSAPTVGAVGNLSDQTSWAAGVKGDLAGTVTSAGVITVTGGGSLVLQLLANLSAKSLS
ncbi:MAG: hypothetical protein CM15mV20_2600 [uncultured marine virus]|nr:MAG: hypothetical protein CM15mV20_2600 [uncultured marine virus]